MTELSGQPGELHMTLTITRKATGKVETVDVIGRVIPDEQPKDKDVGHTQHGGTGRSD